MRSLYFLIFGCLVLREALASLAFTKSFDEDWYGLLNRYAYNQQAQVGFCVVSSQKAESLKKYLEVRLVRQWVPSLFGRRLKAQLTVVHEGNPVFGQPLQDKVLMKGVKTVKYARCFSATFTLPNYKKRPQALYRFAVRKHHSFWFKKTLTVSPFFKLVDPTRYDLTNVDRSVQKLQNKMENAMKHARYRSALYLLQFLQSHQMSPSFKSIIIRLCAQDEAQKLLAYFLQLEDIPFNVKLSTLLQAITSDQPISAEMLFQALLETTRPGDDEYESVKDTLYEAIRCRKQLVLAQVVGRAVGLNHMKVVQFFRDVGFHADYRTMALITKRYYTGNEQMQEILNEKRDLSSFPVNDYIEDNNSDSAAPNNKKDIHSHSITI